MGFFIRVMVLVILFIIVVIIWVCWVIVIVFDLCIVMMGRVDVLVAEEIDVFIWVVAVFSMRVVGLFIWRG